jgi:putative protease
MASMNKIELLSPAGSKEAFIAAIEAGTDAVYCGLQNFSARSKAQNFSSYDFYNYTAYAHKKNVKVYAAFNTLLQENEIHAAVKQLNFLSQSGVDALIVQDLGIANIVKKYFPNLKLHASTQLSIHNSYGVFEAQKAGFKRVVLSRELSFQEIKSIAKNTDIELEIFGHGALCFSVSGLCLMSSFIGGCSGNRGKCTQPCRRKWEISNKNGFYLSPKDFDLSGHIKELKESGITSLKIEGRMKNPQYVYNTVKAYKTLINSCDDNLCKDAKELLKQDLARTKTTFNFIRKSEDIFTPEMPKQIGLYLGKIISVNNNTITLDTDTSLNIGDELKIADALKDISYKAQILNIKNVSGKYELEINSSLVKKGMLVFKTSDIKIAKIIEYIFTKTAISKQKFTIKDKSLALPVFKSNKTLEELFLKIDDPNWLAYIKDKNIYPVFVLNKENIKNTDLFKRFNYFELPAYIEEFDLQEFQKAVDTIAMHDKNKFFINNLSHFHFFKNNKISLYAGSFIYTLNSFSVDFLFSKGIKNFTFSLEDDLKNITILAKKNLYSNSIFYISGFPVLAVSLMTPHKDLIQNKQFIINSSRDSFQVINKNGKIYITTQFPVMLFNKLNTLKKLKINKFIIDLSFIKPNKIYLDFILDAYKKQYLLQNDVEFNFERGLK